MFWYHFLSHIYFIIIICVCVSVSFSCWRFLHFLTWCFFFSQWKHRFFFQQSFLKMFVFWLLIYSQFIDCSWFFFLFLFHFCWLSQEFSFLFSCCFFQNQLSIHITILIMSFKSLNYSIFVNLFLISFLSFW